MPNGVMDGKNLIDGFIDSYVVANGLDKRTEKAYRMDVEHFYAWKDSGSGSMDCREGNKNPAGITPVAPGDVPAENCWEDWIEAYLDYLSTEKQLSFSTVYRKHRVLGYYLSYLVRQGVVLESRPLKPVEGLGQKKRENQPGQNLLSRKEADAFFLAMNREYEALDSEFRRRVCLRDMVMMELLFYHKIQISELLQIEISDYDRETGLLVVHRKRGEKGYIHVYSQELLRKMDLWLDERKAFQHKGEGEHCNKMFLSKYGKALSMEMFIQIFDKYRKLAGIEKKFTPKDLKENSMRQYAKELMIERCS